MEFTQKGETEAILPKNLFYEATDMTPKIHLDYTSGIFEISGISIPENAWDFFRPVINWLDNYLEYPQDKTVFKIFLEYFNSGSSKCLWDIFKKMEALGRKTCSVLIEWHFDKSDEDMHEAGEDFESILDIPFTFVEDKSTKGSQ